MSEMNLQSVQTLYYSQNQENTYIEDIFGFSAQLYSQSDIYFYICKHLAHCILQQQHLKSQTKCNKARGKHISFTQGDTRAASQAHHHDFKLFPEKNLFYSTTEFWTSNCQTFQEECFLNKITISFVVCIENDLKARITGAIFLV